MMDDLRIRSEMPGDEPGIHAVNAAAFPTDAEARLVDALRGTALPQVSLVAEIEGGGDRTIVGHVLFTPVSIGSEPGSKTGEAASSATVAASSRLDLGLGPMAVLPAWQRRGVGTALGRAGLDACREIGAGVVVVLGHPEFYPRFGFRPASEHGLQYGELGPSPAFMVRELVPGALAGRSGRVRYHPEFDGV